MKMNKKSGIQIPKAKIRSNIYQFMKGMGKNRGRNPNERYASFDYCYNYFQGFRETCNLSELGNTKNIQFSCLQLAFYLASWGMLRESSFLLEKSVKYFEPTIDLIANYDKKIWAIDLDNYNDENIDVLLDFKEKLRNSLDTLRIPSDTLITKIMLGAYANTPAFDDFFGVGFGVKTFNRKSLEKISKYYKKHRKLIDGYKIYTYDYLTGEITSRLYSKAKIIDMVGFIEGQNIRELENSRRKKNKAQ